MGFRAELHPDAGVVIYRDFDDLSCFRLEFGQLEAAMWYPTTWQIKLPGGVPDPSAPIEPIDGASLTSEQALELAQALVDAVSDAPLEAGKPTVGELRDFLDGFGEVTLKR